MQGPEIQLKSVRLVHKQQPCYRKETARSRANFDVKPVGNFILVDFRFRCEQVVLLKFSRSIFGRNGRPNSDVFEVRRNI